MAIRKSITKGMLEALNTAVSFVFDGAFSTAKPSWSKIAENVKSTTSIQTYTWLGQMPGMKKWVGERQIKRLEREAYQLVNEEFEDTIGIKRTEVEDDQTGQLKMAAKGLAQAAAEHPDELVYDALGKGFEMPCFDGQNFFDADHSVLNKAGEEVSVSNMQAGDGSAWYLLCTTKSIKPLIYQERIKAELEIMADPDNPHVFMQSEFLYGTRSRGAAGYSYWQLAFGSKAPLTKQNFEKARTAMMELFGDKGRPLNIVPNMLVIPPSLESAADEILVVDRLENGRTNPNKGRAEIHMTPWLSAA